MFSLLPAPYLLLSLPIAALRTPSAAIELTPKTLAMTKTPVKQAQIASELSAGKVQLQR
jgi:hypothetical protein